MSSQAPASKLRLFVALPVTKPVRDAIEAALAGVWRRDDVVWTRPSGWHVTLAFIGSVEPGMLAPIEAVVAPAVAEVGARHGLGGDGLRLSLGEATTLASRVAVIETQDEPAGIVGDLGAAVQEALAEADLPVHRRPVRPHLTLARTRRGTPGLPRDLAAELPSVEASWHVDRAVIYRSLLGRGPARYEAVAELPLTLGG